MQCKQIGNRIYLRVDKGEDVLACVLQTCADFSLTSATFQGIGACENVGIQTYIPEKDDFDQTEIEGMLEMVSLIGNITQNNDGNLFEHTHGIFAYLDKAGEHCVIAGHIHHAIIGYTGEITIDPAEETIGRKVDPLTGITIWDLD
jgi:predicted DNA-binding protein with PD1-like motif